MSQISCGTMARTRIDESVRNEVSVASERAVRHEAYRLTAVAAELFEGGILCAPLLMVVVQES